MIIKRLINNNIVVSKDSNGREIIAVGKGIGYRRKPGDYCDDHRIEKTYQFMDPSMSNQFQELLPNVPIQYVMLSDRMIRYIKQAYDKKVNDTLNITILDHISSSLQRHEKGIDLKNPMLWDIQKFYKEEYAIGLELLDMIEQETTIRLSDDEAGFLALHIVNAQLESSMGELMDITNIVHSVLNIVKYQFHIRFDEESVHYFRFITHLKFFAQRMLGKQETIDNEDDQDMLELVRIKHPKEYNVTFLIEEYLKKNYGYTMSNDERLYLCIHMARVVNTCL